MLSMLTLTYGLLSAQESMLKEAETAYISENYTRAAELYEDILKNYGVSYTVYYNLGNAYYKAGKIASAILNYERALLINPGDKDLRHNLTVAKLRTIDKIEPVGEFFLITWFRSMQNLFRVDTWATIGLICFALFIGCLAFYVFSKRMILKKSGFYVGIVLLALVITANVFAWNQKQALQNRNGAIVFAPTVTIKSSPDNSGMDLFVLHEGTKVFIKSTIGEWNEIELEDGNVGWIRQKDLEKI
ncbi:MAG: tetratricopeptide repeat protein [Tannerella sp.]|jgi:tetratricopeptide (TPR) repeat protein|nr:tetratricopeptide repeat protein [Tannerella sp.]